MIFDFINKVESSYNIGLSINGSSHAAIKSYLQMRISNLCHNLDITVKELPFEFVFTDVEFNKHIPDENEESFINKTFYPKLFNDLMKRKIYDERKDKEVWTLDYTPKFCFTLDRSLTPKSSASGIEYGVLNLGNKPVLYYVWIDVQDIIYLIKSM